MKVVVLAGGLGTRISEESHLRPKPMIEIGNRPILWHIMKLYGHHGLNEFVICCGYRGFIIKEYFANYFLHMSDVTINFSNNKIDFHNPGAEAWKVTLVDTGETTQTGGRIKRITPYLDDGPFCLTYGDGVSDVDISALIKHHQSEKTEATITAVQPTGRFGALVIQENRITAFQEKPKGDRQWINGGFMVCEPSILNRLADDETVFEREPLEGLARDHQLAIWKHYGYWMAMDTLRDKNELEDLWSSNQAPWKVWS